MTTKDTLTFSGRIRSVKFALPNFHPIAEKAKDVAAGAVLLAAVGAIIIGALVFWPTVVGLIQ